jgi:hypothetical protein
MRKVQKFTVVLLYCLDRYVINVDDEKGIPYITEGEQSSGMQSVKSSKLKCSVKI